MQRLPLGELWNSSGGVDGWRGSNLSDEQVRAHLRESDLGVVASIGEPLRWLRSTELFDWWKSEARPRLVDPALNGWRLEDFPDERCWVASEWTLANGTTAIAFEEYH